MEYLPSSVSLRPEGTDTSHGGTVAAMHPTDTEYGSAVVPKAAFVDAMQSHWASTLGNVSSPALRTAWGQLADAFNNHIAAHGNPFAETEWTVLSPPTGSGKSQGAAVYCALLAKLPKEKRPGVLIVTRLKADADSMADTINRLAGREVAVGFHSDARKVALADLRNWDVLVITHKAYELALDKLGQGAKIQATWPFFHCHGEGSTRKLVVIDESIDILEESQIDLDGLRSTLAAIPQAVRDEHPEPVGALQFIVGLFEQMAGKAGDAEVREAVLLPRAVEQGTRPDLTTLRAALRQVRFDHQVRKSDSAENARLWAMHDERLKALNHLFASWVYYAKQGKAGHTMNTARLLVPEGCKGAVILDATARHDVFYELFDRTRLIPPPAGVRDYCNVTLHVSRGHKVGKVYMRSHAEEESKALMAGLLDTIPDSAEVFICCHKDVEPILTSFQPPFTMRVGHYGALDGSNAWRSCDTAVIFGLPYLPDTFTANAVFATQGIRDTEWLRADERPFGRHKDIREAIKTGRVVTAVVQAINRIRCRAVVDEHGGCPSANVYLLLPNGAQGDAVLDGIQDAMPGLQVQPWSIRAAKRKPRRGNFEAALVALAQSMAAGDRLSASDIRTKLGISTATWERLAAVLRDPFGDLSASLAVKGVQYKVVRSGKTQRGFFVKDTQPA